MIIVVNLIKLTLVKMLLAMSNDMIKENEYCSKFNETEFIEFIFMTKNIIKILKILLNIGNIKRNMTEVK